mmetsp:Transcript_6411/g.8411  ORF Transcript_6411/g.8411 Transcript_6411/m.8411 type:complete len:175 (+) Transcript_6411:39-563(+)
MSFPGRQAQRAWHLIDASNQTVGRLAATIAPILKGKHKPTYRPNGDCGDYVVVINADKVDFTGKKWTDKLYRHHTGYPGGLKTRRALDLLQRQPESILRKATLGMLSRNNLRHKYIEPRLRIYAGSEHPYASMIGTDMSNTMEPVPRKKEANYHFGLGKGYAGATLPKDRKSDS